MKKPWFRRRPSQPLSSLPQGFDVKVTLRRGDKVVRRTRKGDVEILQITTDIARLDFDGEDRGVA
ncbi:MAG: hypothetical protein HYU51_12575 [Candidatus Rokubacteria bacterium]|nr:hypothetical protein [Candidatus Rokubacteria bacterium]